MGGALWHCGRVGVGGVDKMVVDWGCVNSCVCGPSVSFVARTVYIYQLL